MQTQTQRRMLTQNPSDLELMLLHASTNSRARIETSALLCRRQIQALHCASSPSRPTFNELTRSVASAPTLWPLLSHPRNPANPPPHLSALPITLHLALSAILSQAVPLFAMALYRKSYRQSPSSRTECLKRLHERPDTHTPHLQSPRIIKTLPCLISCTRPERPRHISWERVPQTTHHSTLQTNKARLGLMRKARQVKVHLN